MLAFRQLCEGCMRARLSFVAHTATKGNSNPFSPPASPADGPKTYLPLQVFGPSAGSQPSRRSNQRFALALPL